MAGRRLAERVEPPDRTDSVARDAIAGRIVAAAVTVPDDVPPTDFATMDGFAVATDDGGDLRVVGSVEPADAAPAIDRGEAVRVATGAPLPERADAVVPVEDATVTDDQLAPPDLEPGTNAYPAGATAAAGERLFEPGDRLAARHAALLADVGVESVTVYEPWSVGILATGTEIHEGEQPDRDSEMLANLVRRWGGEPTLLGSIPDEEPAVREAIESAAASHDAVLTSGGTSVGRGDHVGTALAAHDLLFTGVALRPGRPVTAALVDGTPVVGLPGKPMAAHTAATLVARPAFAGGDATLPTRPATPTARVELPDTDADVEYAVPVRLTDAGAVPLGHGDSSHQLYRTGSDGADSRFAPGRVASSTRVALTDGVVVTTEPLSPDDPAAVVPWGVVE
ncbi:MAG: molybdopterin molybdotransferase MoeA [Haloglomus sp.]